MTVYFHADTGLIPVRRTVPRTSMVATAALRQLLAGPTTAERAEGIWSVFSGRTAGMLRSVRIADGVGYADFGDLRQAIPNASSSAGSEVLLAELDATLKQFGTVRSTVYSLTGDVEAFYQWLQRVSPTTGAAAAARQFATGVLGMVRPTVGQPRRGSGGTVTVTVRTRVAEGGLSGLATEVSLRRAGAAWSVTGARNWAVRSESPRTLQAVSPPVHVTARLMPYMPGEAEVRVVQVLNGTATVLGRGRLTGPPEGLFSADIAYRRPAAAAGWVLVVERSIEADGPVRKGEVLGGDAIRVRFATAARPVIVSVSTLPSALPVRDGWWVLPDGAGTVGINAQVRNTDRVEFYLVPTGTNTWPNRVRLPVDGTAGHPYNATLNYKDEPMTARIVIIATGPGGSTTYSHNIYHS